MAPSSGSPFREGAMDPPMFGDNDEDELHDLRFISDTQSSHHIVEPTYEQCFTPMQPDTQRQLRTDVYIEPSRLMQEPDRQTGSHTPVPTLNA